MRIWPGCWVLVQLKLYFCPVVSELSVPCLLLTDIDSTVEKVWTHLFWYHTCHSSNGIFSQKNRKHKTSHQWLTHAFYVEFYENLSFTITSPLEYKVISNHFSWWSFSMTVKTEKESFRPICHKEEIESFAFRISRSYSSAYYSLFEQMNLKTPNKWHWLSRSLYSLMFYITLTYYVSKWLMSPQMCLLWVVFSTKSKIKSWS